MDITASTLTLPIRNSPSTTPNNTPMPSPTSMPDLTIWQAKALQKNPARTPLPNAPNSRPWLSLKPTQLKRAIKRAYDNERKRVALRAKEKKRNSEKRNTSRKVWQKEEIEKLATMRESGSSWSEIQVSLLVIFDKLMMRKHFALDANKE